MVVLTRVARRPAGQNETRRKILLLNNKPSGITAQKPLSSPSRIPGAYAGPDGTHDEHGGDNPDRSLFLGSHSQFSRVM